MLPPRRGAFPSAFCGQSSGTSTAWKSTNETTRRLTLFIEAFIAVQDDVSIQAMRQGKLDADRMMWVRMLEDAARFAPERLVRDVWNFFQVFCSVRASSIQNTAPLVNPH